MMVCEDQIPRLRAFTCTDHEAMWPVGVASYVVAEDEVQARKLLDLALQARRLRPYADFPYTLVEIDLDLPHARVLRDGDY
jgi:hypothetical protein